MIATSPAMIWKTPIRIMIVAAKMIPPIAQPDSGSSGGRSTLFVAMHAPCERSWDAPSPAATVTLL